MELNGVYLISFLDDEVESFKLVFKDEELDLISKDIVDPNVKNIKFNYFDTQDNPRKYFLNKKDEDAYQINYFDKFIQSINNCESANKLKYEIKLVAYKFDKLTLIYKKTINRFAKKTHIAVPSSKNKKYKLLDFSKIVSLPYDNDKLICGWDEEKYYVFQATEFDNAFNAVETKKRYMSATMDKFLKKEYKLTKSGNLEVEFSNIDKIKQIINNNLKMLDAICKFNNTKRNKINKLEIEDINKAINYLNNLANNGSNLTQEMIPKIKGQTLFVDEESVRYFVAFLDNKVMQNILDGTVKVPYYAS